MADFIDRHATINAVGMTTDAVNFNQKYVDAQGNELVAVVRCKDCKYLDIANNALVYACCSKHNHIFYLWEEDTRKHFCSWAERREDAYCSEE